MKTTSPKSRAALLAIGLALLAIYHLAALGAPVGAVEDDSLHILLARALRHGAFALPDALGAPVNDPLPGFAALIALPVLLVEPHWGLLRFLGLISAGAVIFLAWRLARRFLGETEALAAGLLTALNPVMVDRAGLVLPDLLFLALSLILFESMLAPALSATLLLAAGAGAAALLRPHGAILILSLGVGIWAAKGWRRAAAFLMPASVPLALWTLRNSLLTVAASGYIFNLSTEAARLAEPRAAFWHAVGLLAAAGGDGLLALAGLPGGWLAAAGLTALLAAGAGTVRLLREREDPRIYAVACYGILLMAQHLVWTPIQTRYILVFLPFAWILILAGCSALEGKARTGVALALGAILILSLRADLTLAKSGLRGSAEFQPATMAWLREHTPAEARIASLECTSVDLFSGRRAVVPSLDVGNRDAWLDWSLRQGIGYLHVVSSFPAGGYYPAPARRLAENLERWAASTPYAHEVYRNPAETTAVFRIEHPAPSRFLKACDAYSAAIAALRLASPPAEIRGRVDEAISLEPRLALPWVLLAHLESAPDKKRRFLEEAVRRDPTLQLSR